MLLELEGYVMLHRRSFLLKAFLWDDETDQLTHVKMRTINYWFA